MSGGQLITVGQGTLSPGTHGLEIVSGQGILTASGNAVTVNISGAEATFLQGTVVIGPTLITGIAATLSAGTAGISRDLALTGSSMTASAGTVIAGQEADDTYVTVGQGTSAVNYNIAISGIESTMGQGTIVFSQGGLTGSSATFSQQSFPAFQTLVAIAGQSITVSDGTLTQTGGTAFLGDLHLGGKGDNPYGRIYKPTGLVDKKATPTIRDRIDESAALHAEAVAKAYEPLVADSQIVEDSSIPTTFKPVESMSQDEIDFEIKTLLNKKIRTEEEELLLLMLMMA